MKKSLIALAALAATASFAQSSVTISGTVDAALTNTNVVATDGAAAVKNTGLSHSNRGTTGVVFSGVEDLGGGLKAEFLWELNYNPANTGSLAGAGSATAATAAANANDTAFQTGQSYAGLSGAFGSLRAGAPNTPSLTAMTSRQPFGTKIGGGYTGALGTGRVRYDNSVVYATPKFGGFTAALGYAFKTKDATTVTQASYTDFGLNYANGPLRAGVAYFETEKTGTGVKGKQTNLYGQYDIGAATLYLGYGDETTTANVKQKGYNVAAKYAVTPTVALLANYADLDVKNSTQDKKTTALGAEYALSKRSTIYVRYAEDKTDTTTIKTKTTLLGLDHRF